ncbi:hypothetical protein [Neobacillus niacini]|uniref:hypothetical protein n=1 Tax=Neobacillus niacini TaxID=86668 RepID=UPI003983640F
MHSEDYNKFTKTELIKMIENLMEQIEHLEERHEDFEVQLEQLKAENEIHMRSIHDYGQKESEEEIYRHLPHVRPLWMRKGFDY